MILEHPNLFSKISFFSQNIYLISSPQNSSLSRTRIHTTKVTPLVKLGKRLAINPGGSHTVWLDDLTHSSQQRTGSSSAALLLLRFPD